MKISIITISYNSERYLEQTMQSVVGQSYTDKEYIVVDGGSTDGTIDIIRKYQDRIDRWISEPDNGIGDAMNKGLAMATGDLIIFLHSDDYFIDHDALATAAPHLSTDYDIFMFNIFLVRNNVKKLFKPRGLNWWMNLKTGVYHQSTMCRRELFTKIGNFDTDLRIGMDYDLFLRAYRADIKAKKIDLPLSVMRLSGLSSQLDWPSLQVRFREEQLIHRKNKPSLGLKIIYFFYRFLYPPYLYCRSCLGDRL